MIESNQLDSLVNDVASFNFYGKDRMPKEYAAAVKRMESHPDYPAYKAKIDADAKLFADQEKAADKAFYDNFM